MYSKIFKDIGKHSPEKMWSSTLIEERSSEKGCTELYHNIAEPGIHGYAAVHLVVKVDALALFRPLSCSGSHCVIPFRTLLKHCAFLSRIYIVETLRVYQSVWFSKILIRIIDNDLDEQSINSGTDIEDTQDLRGTDLWIVANCCPFSQHV